MKQIEGFEGYYINELGDVFSDRKHNANINGKLRKLKSHIINSGYLGVAISINKKSLTKKIHRLVALAFIPNPENKPQVNHKNGIKSDNRVENLEWVTSSENTQHAFDTGLKVAIKGENNANSKLTEYQVLLIRADLRSQREIAEEYNIANQLVSKIKSKKVWKHVI